jgi:excinuclease UvrABC ATPase subunit
LHNLKNVDVAFPRDRLAVVTGLSGSGKSSLGPTTIYTEEQRQYVEGPSAYARRFLGQMDRAAPRRTRDRHSVNLQVCLIGISATGAAIPA